MKRFLVLLFLPLFAFAAIGEITSLSGEVKIKRESGDVVAAVGTQLEKNDFISTDDKGKVQILFNDKTVFTIGKSSTLDIAEYLYDETNPSQNKAQFNVLKGAFSSITGRIGKLNKSKFKLQTKSASIGIRGTIVKANQDVIMCTEGAITVETIYGASVLVEAGEKTIIANGVPSVPTPISNEEASGINQEAGVDDESTQVQEGSEIQGSEQTSNAIQSSVESSSADLQKEESIAQTVEQKAIETKNIILKGRTINSSGSQQYITIEADNVQNELTLSDSGLTMTDDQGNAVDSVSSDNVVTWGYWNSDATKKWVAGQETDVKVIEELQSSTNSVNAAYSGKVMGTVNGSDNIKMDETNSINLNFSLGQSSNTMNGDIGFQTQSGQNWNTNVAGTVSGNTFSSTSVSGGNVDTGVVDGKFYGSEAQSVGGTFDLRQNADQATGVFKADKK